MKKLVFSLYLLILFFVLSAGCSKQNQASAATDRTPVPMPEKKDSLHYLALGDSYTIGQNVAATERFPYLTTLLLREQKIPVADPKYIATTGWTTANLLTAISNETSLKTYDMVTLLIGVNDQYQHLDTAGYRIRFTQLLDKAISLAGNRRNRVFVLSIPDYSATPFVTEPNKNRVHTELALFNAINKEVTLGYNIVYVDITSLTQEAATDASLLANDNLHYSGKEHQKWASMLAPEVQKAIQ